MAKFREEQYMTAELKWQKVSNQKFPQYRRFVDYFFALNGSRKAHFHALMLDSHQFDHTAFNKGDKEIGFYKFYYQLLLNCFGKTYCEYDPDARFAVVLDNRNTSYKLEDLRKILNNGMQKKHGISTRPFNTIEPRCSKSSEVLQINDIILGAVGFHKNSRELIADSRQAKKDLANYIAEQAGLPNLKVSTPQNQTRFTLWNFRLQRK